MVYINFYVIVFCWAGTRLVLELNTWAQKMMQGSAQNLGGAGGSTSCIGDPTLGEFVLG